MLQKSYRRCLLWGEKQLTVPAISQLWVFNILLFAIFVSVHSWILVASFAFKVEPLRKLVEDQSLWCLGCQGTATDPVTLTIFCSPSPEDPTLANVPSHAGFHLFPRRSLSSSEVWVVLNISVSQAAKAFAESLDRCLGKIQRKQNMYSLSCERLFWLGRALEKLGEALRKVEESFSLQSSCTSFIREGFHVLLVEDGEMTSR